jgi:thiamine pyrophosphate-dependent acetolactate synthase large subunit-like protein
LALTPPPPEPVLAASEQGIQQAIEILKRSRQPLICAGLGAAGARGALLELAERLGAPVATTFQGKGMFPESRPLALWPGFMTHKTYFTRGVVKTTLGRLPWPDRLRFVGRALGRRLTG